MNIRLEFSTNDTKLKLFFPYQCTFLISKFAIQGTCNIFLLLHATLSCFGTLATRIMRLIHCQNQELKFYRSNCSQQQQNSLLFFKLNHIHIFEVIPGIYKLIVCFFFKSLRNGILRTRNLGKWLLLWNDSSPSIGVNFEW